MNNLKDNLNVRNRWLKRVLSSLFIAGFLVTSLPASDRNDGVQLENWMTIPFSEDITSNQSSLESWMTVPFELASEESSVNLESWMTVPFDLSFEESSLNLESWMTVPFGVESGEQTVSL